PVAEQHLARLQDPVAIPVGVAEHRLAPAAEQRIARRDADATGPGRVLLGEERIDAVAQAKHLVAVLGEADVHTPGREVAADGLRTEPQLEALVANRADVLEDVDPAAVDGRGDGDREDLVL